MGTLSLAHTSDALHLFPNNTELHTNTHISGRRVPQNVLGHSSQWSVLLISQIGRAVNSL